MINPAQPPEGILDPQQPWWPADKVGQASWLRLKGKLTGRPIAEMSGEQHTSYVRLSEADADRLIQNLKKYGQYPQVNQNDKYGGAYNAEAYQKWLVEEFLEKPFREEVNKKIDEKEIQDRVETLVQKFKQKKPENVEPQEKLFPVIIDPWEGSYKTPSEVILIQPKEEGRKAPLLLPPATTVAEEIPLASDEPEKPEEEGEDEEDKEIRELSGAEEKENRVSPVPLPAELPEGLRKQFVTLGKEFDKISGALSAQNILIRRNIFKQKKISYSLSIIEQLIQDQIENYVEAIADFEMRQIEIASEVPNITVPQPEPPSLDSQEPPAPAPAPAPPPDKQSEGKISYRPVTSDAKVITPGVYDNPTVGQLLPGFAVIPYNRNYGKQILSQYDMVEYEKSLLESLRQPMKVAVAGTAVKIGESVTSLGVFAPFFAGSLSDLAGPLGSALDISPAAAADLLGGQQYLGDAPIEKRFSDFFRLWGSVMKDKGWVFGSRRFTGPESPRAGEGDESESGAEVDVQEGLFNPSLPSPYRDTDGEDTGFDISLAGRGTNGYGRGIVIRNPLDNLYYFKKVPAGFPRAGQDTRGVQTTTDRVAKGRGDPRTGFGRWATYYIKDSNGSWYELVIAHLDKMAPTWNDTGNGVLLNKGVKIGVQGASGSSDGGNHPEANPDGTADHISTHVNYNRNDFGTVTRAAELLIDFANKLHSYRTPTRQPSAPPLAEGGIIQGIQSWIGGQIQRAKNTVTNIRNTATRLVRAPLQTIRNAIYQPFRQTGLARGVRSTAGFTGMDSRGYNAISRGDPFKLGRFKPQILGRGAYSSPFYSRPKGLIKGLLNQGAMGYAGTQGSLGGRQIPGGVIKTIVPGGAWRIPFLEQQMKVAPATFDKGKRLADRLLSGYRPNSALANRLRSQLMSGVGEIPKFRSFKMPRIRGGSPAVQVFLALIQNEMENPVGTAKYDQVYGPNAYYKDPSYKGPKPDYAYEKGGSNMPRVSGKQSNTAVATQSQKTASAIVNFVPLPSQPSIAPSSSSGSSSPNIVTTNTSTRNVMSTTHARRL